jgi:hypothetical protein
MNQTERGLAFVPDDDYFNDYGFTIEDLIYFIRCETYLAVNCGNENDIKCAKMRMTLIKRELISRYKFIKVNGIRYAVDKEDYDDFEGGVIMELDLYEVSGFISKREFKLKNVGCSVGVMTEEQAIFHPFLVVDRPFNMNICGGKIKFDGGICIGDLNREIVGKKLRYLFW